MGSNGILTGILLFILKNRRNKRQEIKQCMNEYLKIINNAYSLFKKGEYIIYDLNRSADATNLVREIEKSIKSIEDYRLNYSIELAQFYMECAALVEFSYRELNLHWQEWCNPDAESAYTTEIEKGDARDWSVFSISRFYSTYDTMKGKLNALRRSVIYSMSKI